MEKASGKKSHKPPYNIERYSIMERKSNSKTCELDSHNWREATMRNSIRAYKITFCFVCDGLMFDTNGNVTQWLLDQGFIYEDYKRKD